MKRGTHCCKLLLQCIAFKETLPDNTETYKKQTNQPKKQKTKKSKTSIKTNVSHVPKKGEG